MSANSASYLATLHQQIDTAFSFSDIKTLCLSLEVDAENIPGGHRAAFVRNLIVSLARKKRLQDLVDTARRKRPRVAWQDVPTDFALPASIAQENIRQVANYQVYSGDVVHGNVDKSTTAFNQAGQTVQGSQVNIAGDANIGQIGNSMHTGGGDYVEGDKTVHTGDTVYGDKVGDDKVDGDKISVGNISGSSGIAIGRGAQAQVNQGLGGAELTELFAPLLLQVTQQNPQAVPQVNALKEEVGKGEEADDETMADLITAIAEAAPTAVEGIVNLFTNAMVAKAAGGATKYILKRIGKKR